jgi:hypothetical protein
VTNEPTDDDTDDEGVLPPAQNPACRKTASLREALQHHNHNQNEE